MMSRTYLSIERSAALYRRELLPNLDPAAPLPGANTVLPALAGVPVIHGRDAYSVEYAAHELPQAVEAETYFDAKKAIFVVGLAPAVFGDLELGKSRARFTLAHELGHRVLHTLELMKLSRLPHTEAALLRTRVPVHPNCEDTEWQANAFAAAMLMPVRGLRDLERAIGHLDDRNVAIRFSVSRCAARNRLIVYRSRKAEFDRL